MIDKQTLDREIRDLALRLIVKLTIAEAMRLLYEDQEEGEGQTETDAKKGVTV